MTLGAHLSDAWDQLRGLISRLPGARTVWRAVGRLRTPLAVRTQLDALSSTVERLEAELAELRELSLRRLEVFPSPADAGEGLPLGSIVTVSAGHRRVICSIGTGPYGQVLDVSSVTFRGYASLHGWDVVLSTEWLVPERPVSWSKIELVRRLLNDYDEVFWVDADAIFVDISQDISELTSVEKDLYLVEHLWAGGQRRSANLGVFLIRASEWSTQLLDAIWGAEAFIDHPWWENAALLDMLGYELPADLTPPRKVRTSPLEERVKFLGLEWNSGITGDSRSDHPRIRHHGRRSIPDLRRQLLADLVTYQNNLLRLPT